MNIIVAVIYVVESLAYIESAPLASNLENVFGIFLTVLVVVGIIQASRFIRMLVLVCSWIAALAAVVSIPLGLIYIGPQALWGLITLAVCVVTIWGLSKRRSKAYFGY